MSPREKEVARSMKNKQRQSNILFLPVSDNELPKISISTLFGNALIGGITKPKFVADENYIYLPSVYESSFENYFISVVQSHSIDFVISQHPVVIDVMEKLINRQQIETRIISIHPQRAIDLQYTSAKTVIENIKSIFALTIEVETAELLALAAVLDGVIGSTPISKAWALYLLCLQLDGDLIVEIGVMFGSSALAQALAFRGAGRIFIGVDTYDNSEAQQSDSPNLLNNAAKLWDRAHMQRIAESLLKISGCDFELLKADSFEAVKIIYNKYPKKKISLLHIDANHDYDKVRNDYHYWKPLLSEKHILVLDDTKWTGGQGPSNLAQELRLSQTYQRVIEFAGSTFFFAY
jgi:cephalosporin hydroxylase